MIAEKPGDSSKVIIVGAHFDTAPVPGDKGADDNGSGLATMLEIAQRIAYVPTHYTIRFITFGAEEAGDLGSAYYVSQMSDAEIQNTVEMIVMDSLVAGDIAYIHGAGDNRAPFDLGLDDATLQDPTSYMRDWALDWANDHGYPLQIQTGLNPAYPAGVTDPTFSDSGDFAAKGIPYVYFEATNWALGDLDGYTQVALSAAVPNGEIWHTHLDNLSSIDRLFPGRVNSNLETFSATLYHILTRFRR